MSYAVAAKVVRCRGSREQINVDYLGSVSDQRPVMTDQTLGMNEWHRGSRYSNNSKKDELLFFVSVSVGVPREI